MTILNQTYTGMPCPLSIHYLKDTIKNRGNSSMMMQISVSAWELAIVLDRLDYLERYEKYVQTAIEKGVPYK